MAFAGTMEITTTIGCPLRCTYCPQSVLQRAYTGPSRKLALEDFRVCLERLPTAVRIDFSGMAEPWLNPDCTAMLREAANAGHPLAVYTTLVGMNRADLASLAEIEIDPMVFHLPDERGNTSIPLMQDYMERIDQALTYLAHGARWRHPRISSHGKLHPFLVEQFQNRLEDLQLPVVQFLSDRAGNLPESDLSHRSAAGRLTCASSGRDLNHNVLLPDGSVILCCMDYGCQHVLGSLLEQPYEELFQGAEFLRIQAALDQPEKPVLCRRCVRAVPLSEE